VKTIDNVSTLVYYDGPQVLSACDEFGAHYIAVLADAADTGDRFIVAPVTTASLRQFRIGSMDLPSLMLEHGETEWY